MARALRSTAAMVLATSMFAAACSHADGREDGAPQPGEPRMTQTPAAPSNGASHFKSRVIVFYRDGVDSASARAANAAVGATLLRPLAVENAAVVTLPEGMPVEEAIRLFKLQPGVRLAEPDGRRTIQQR